MKCTINRRRPLAFREESSTDSVNNAAMMRGETHKVNDGLATGRPLEIVSMKKKKLWWASRAEQGGRKGFSYNSQSTRYVSHAFQFRAGMGFVIFVGGISLLVLSTVCFPRKVYCLQLCGYGSDWGTP